MKRASEYMYIIKYIRTGENPESNKRHYLREIDIFGDEIPNNDIIEVLKRFEEITASQGTYETRHAIRSINISVLGEKIHK